MNSHKNISITFKEINLDKVETTKMEGGYQIRTTVWSCFAEIRSLLNNKGIDKSNKFKVWITTPTPTKNRL